MFKKRKNTKTGYIPDANTNKAGGSAKAEEAQPDKIFVRGHLTDLEKLLFAESEIKELKKKVSELELRLGKQQSDLDEAEFLLKKYKPMSKQEERLEIAKDEHVKDLKLRIKSLEQSNKKHEQEKNALLDKLVAYKDK